MKMLAAVAILFLGQAQGHQIGVYTPNSQLLSWCKSRDPAAWASCHSFISGVVEASGMPQGTWSKGAIELPIDVYAPQTVPIVVGYIEALPPEAMSSSAAQSVYEALVAKYPHSRTTAPSRQ